MSKAIIFILMIFFHILDDFGLQRMLHLADYKQKSWWVAHPQYAEMYEYDYVAGLIIHSITWSFMITVPILLFHQNIRESLYVIVYLNNIAWHSAIDSAKCNLFKINLWQDQLFHLLQIIVTFIVLVMI